MTEPMTDERTTVVNIKSGEPYDVYIGRAVPRKGLKRSVWHNPYSIGRDGDRDEVIAMYEIYLRSRPDLMARLSELRGKRLGCWCSPAACHGNVLARLADVEAH